MLTSAHVHFIHFIINHLIVFWQSWLLIVGTNTCVHWVKGLVFQFFRINGCFCKKFEARVGFRTHSTQCLWAPRKTTVNQGSHVNKTMHKHFDFVSCYAHQIFKHLVFVKITKSFFFQIQNFIEHPTKTKEISNLLENCTKVGQPEKIDFRCFV